MKILKWAFGQYIGFWTRADRWRARRFPNVRSAWIRNRRLELIEERAGEHENEWGDGHDWRYSGAEELARTEWRVVQHRSRLGLLHRRNIAAEWVLIVCFWLSLTWPVLLLAGWLASHVSVAWAP